MTAALARLLEVFSAWRESRWPSEEFRHGDDPDEEPCPERH